MTISPETPHSVDAGRPLEWTDAGLLALLVFVLDALTKVVVWAFATPGVRYPVLGDVVRLLLVKNLLFGFSIPLPGLPGQWAYIALILGGLALVMVCYRITPPQARLAQASLVLIGAGGLANLLERAFTGGVTDFVSIGIGSHRWPTFNVADIAVSVGVVIYLAGAWHRGGWRGLLIGAFRQQV